MARMRDALNVGGKAKRYAVSCTRCRRRATLNRGRICTPCLNGEAIPDTPINEPITEEETPVDREYWDLTKTTAWRHARLKLEGDAKFSKSPPPLKRLREINDAMFLELEVG